MKLIRRGWLNLLMSMGGVSAEATTGAGEGPVGSDYSLPSPSSQEDNPSGDRLERFKTAFGTAEIVDRAALLDQAAWRDAFAGVCKDHRYYEACETTLRQPNFDYRYLTLRDHGGTIRAIQPFFFTDQDLTVGLSATLRAPVAAIRRHFPNFLTMKMLMVGCTAGEGHVAVTGQGDRAGATRALIEALQIHARAKRAAIITFKDFPDAYRQALDAAATPLGFVRMPSFPATILPLDRFKDFEDYLSLRLGKSMRKNLRRKFRPPEESQAATDAITMEMVVDVSPFIDEIHPLYQQVLARSNFRFEELTKEYLCRLGQTMPDRARFFIWRQGGRAVAFSACMVHDGKLYDNYLGLDYRVALDLHLYFLTIRDLITWGIEQQLRWYYSTPLNYDPKLHLRFDLAPLDLYVRHVSNWVNPFFKRIAPLLEPTRYDKLLRRFDNHTDIL